MENVNPTEQLKLTVKQGKTRVLQYKIKNTL